MHLPQIVEIMRVEHCLSIWTIGEIVQYFLTPLLGESLIILPDGHKIHVEVHVETISVVGVT